MNGASKFMRKSATERGSVGTRLARARRSFGLRVEEIAEDLKIRPDVLHAFERGTFCCIAEPVYRTLMIKTYAEYLGLDWTALSDVYARESLYAPTPEREDTLATPRVGRSEMVVAPRLMKHVLLSGAMIGACVYVMVLAAGALGRPALIVARPPDNFLSSTKTIRIEGTTAPDAALAINGQEVLKSKDGTFHQDVTLSEGVNSITVSASKKYSKESRVTRTVLYQAPPLPLSFNEHEYGKRSN